MCVWFGVRGSSGQDWMLPQGKSDGPVEGMPFITRETGSLNDAHHCKILMIIDDLNLV